MKKRNNIPFSPPDISEEEINEVVDTLRGTWITTGPKTKLFEEKISKLCGTNKTVCLNSATAALELILRVLGIGPGDEVIVPAYTYTASASPVYHVGAKIIICDVAKDSFEMDYEQLPKLINKNTKAIIGVDIAGIVADYDKIFEIAKSKKSLFKPNNKIQKGFGRIIVIADSAHGIGAKRNNLYSGNIADFTSFSFHAVKNLTTAEGGAATWKSQKFINDEELYKQFQLLSLHGQNKDALHKDKLGNWEYDIIGLYYKCNMTDIMASIGLAQLKRYNGLIKKRHEIIDRYNKAFSKMPVKLLNHHDKNHKSSGHYKELGFNIKDYPNAFNQYKNEISLPLYSKLTDEDVDYIIDNFIEVLKEFKLC